MDNSLRQLQLQTALLGLWDIENGSYSWFFFPEYMELIKGGLPITEMKYEAFIKETDNNPYLKIINENTPSGDTQIKEYEIREIDTKKGVLRLLSDLNAELNFHQRKTLR